MTNFIAIPSDILDEVVLKRVITALVEKVSEQEETIKQLKEKINATSTD